MSHFRSAIVCVVSVVVGLAGCSRGPAPASTQPPPATAGAPAPAGPVSSAGAVPGAIETVSGSVLETMNAGNYTYVRVKTDKGDMWAASSQFPVAVGDRVSVPLETPMQNFHSPTLNRDFPLIYFASRITAGGEPAAARASGALPLAVAHSGAPPPGTVPSQDSAKAPAPAGTTPIANVWANRKALVGKTVTVHGKVVKFNGGILDRNWIHVQDGSGKAEDGTNDILVTTDATAKVGDIVTATGVVAVDKDFTAGYAYKVMIEKASIK